MKPPIKISAGETLKPPILDGDAHGRHVTAPPGLPSTFQS